jgi:glycosyltransferase involved in cell wall biosynthesis
VPHRSDRPGEPLVSVLMPVYNAERYVGEAVASILGQSFGDFELLVLDDGSEDGSLDVVEAVGAGDPRLRVFRECHAGLAERLRAGVDHARGELVARQDADDASRPQRFARQVDYLQRHPECSAVGVGALFVDPEGRPIREQQRPLDHREIENLLLSGQGNALIHSGAMFRRDRLIAAGSYRPESEPAEDVDLYLRLAERGRLANLPEVLLVVREHLTRVSKLRAGEQRRRLDAVVGAARRRRGLCAAAPSAAGVPEQLSPAECWRRGARDATEGGHLATARRYAWAALRAEPLRPRSWQILARALLGLRLEPVRRRLRGARAG